MFSFFKHQDKDPSASLRAVLGDYTLPSFSETVTEVMQHIRDPECSAASIGEVLARDPGLSVSVLKMVNSAAFTRTKEVENLTQAIAILGLSQLESLILSASISGTIPNTSAPGYDHHRFWRTAAWRAVTAQELAHGLCPARATECFTAALLQDMAIPFLVQQRPEEYGPILERWHVEGGDLTSLEREVFEWDHAEVATWICHDWHLPENIASAIGGHHQPNNDVFDCPPPVAMIACLRDSEGDDGTQDFVAMATQQFGLPEENAQEAIETGRENAGQFADLFT